MAQDNSAKIRQERKLDRKKPRLPDYERILIVSEGSKTEPLYFKEVINASYPRKARRMVVLSHSSGTTPFQVVESARKFFEDGDGKTIEQCAFDRVFAVFDRDDHLTYEQALSAARKMELLNDNNKPIEFCAIASVPSFELWLLLHYEEIHWPLHRDEVLRRLKSKMLEKHHLRYEKSMEGIYEITKAEFDTARARARHLSGKNYPEKDDDKPCNAYYGDVPYTDVYLLVDLLHRQGRGEKTNPPHCCRPKDKKRLSQKTA